MDKKQTLDLYEKGRDAWNTWARQMLDRCGQIKAAREWAVRRDEHLLEKPDNHTTRGWFLEAKADFAEHTFDKLANFSGFEFPAQAVFERAQFQKGAAFFGTYFDRDAIFERAKFLEAVEFGNEDVSDGARFMGVCLLNRVSFCKDARFTHAFFQKAGRFTDSLFQGPTRFDYVIFDKDGRALFNNATFDSFISFSNVTFGGEAWFEAIHADRAFTLEGARFAKVPNFTQAHFSEAPRLDDVVIPAVPCAGESFWNLIIRKRRVTGTAAEYRALRRLAIQAHDHTLELDLFASELKASGGVTRWTVGLLYELFSNFGRSMVRPLVSLVLSALGFAWAYLDEHFGRAVEAGRSYGMSSGIWLWSRVMAWFTDAAVPPLACLGEPLENPLRAAWSLSLRKALPVPGIGSTEELYVIQACLFGQYDATLKYMPKIPDLVACLGIFQLQLSLVLLFLFLLAVRNHFRIR